MVSKFMSQNWTKFLYGNLEEGIGNEKKKTLLWPSKADFGHLENCSIWFVEGFFEAFLGNQHVWAEDVLGSKMEISNYTVTGTHIF